VRAFGRDRIRAKGIMASGACESRNEGRTHGRTNQRTAAFPKTLANGEPSTHGHAASDQFVADVQDVLGDVL
jgi:hypothetical protein